MDRCGVERIIPHRSPFLWIDRVEELAPGIRCVAVKSIDPDNRVFAGYFPSQPMLPGVLLIEAMAQTAAVMLGSTTTQSTGSVPLLAAVNRFNFLRPVTPGQEIRIEMRKLTEAGRMAYVGGTIWVNGEMVANGELSVVSA